MGRPERIGPRNSASDCIHIVRNRVMPSTLISKTMSARLIPDCGRAIGMVVDLHCQQSAVEEGRVVDRQPIDR